MSATPLPKSCAVSRPVFRGPLFAIDDWHCDGHDTPHGHEEWCADDRIVVTRHGAWELACDGSTQLCDPTTVTFWSREAPYRVRHPIGGRDACTVFRLTTEGRHTLRQALQVRGRHWRPTFPVRSRRLDGPTHLLHRQALAAARVHGDALAVEEAALGFLHRVSDGAPLAHTRGSRLVVDRALDFIGAHFREAISVAQVARSAGASPFHLSRLFSREVGTTLHKRVTELRLREAMERLMEGDDAERLSGLALDLGFASHAHFTDAFRAEYGCSPSEARRRLRPGASPRGA